MNRSRLHPSSFIRMLLLLIAVLLAAGTGVPAGASASGIVNPKQIYTYEIMVRDMKKLAERYPELIRIRSIGKSEYGREIWSMDLGNGPAVVLLNGSHHAREWITTVLLMALADRYAQAYVQNGTIGSYRAVDLLDRVTFRIVPMVNPDGVTLQQKGAGAFPAEVRPQLLRLNGGSSNFKRWKANAKGIDLNRQYPAGWGNIHNPAPAPGYKNYKGIRPIQAKETQAMVKLARETKPEIAVSYHSSGEILYWNFLTPAANVERDRQIANAYAALTGYRLVTPSKNPSGGGFTDWFIQEFGRPALTPEIGRYSGESNVPLTEWDRIWKQHRDIGGLLGGEGYKLWMKRQKAETAKGEIRLTRSETLRRWPDPTADQIAVLYEGRYTVTRKKGDWYEIRTDRGTGWVPANRTLRGPFEKPESDTIVITQGAELFDSPLNEKAAAIQKKAAEAKALEIWRNWALIRIDRKSWWVRTSDIDFVAESPKPGKPSEKAPGKEPEQGSGKVPGDGPSESPGVAPGNEPSEGPGVAPGNEPSEGPGKAPGDEPEQNSEQAPGDNPEQSSEIIPGDKPADGSDNGNGGIREPSAPGTVTMPEEEAKGGGKGSAA
ncbi:hypothetical protein PACILC2_09170 [Paenibacillus cisolokensis]|uniref:Peptidase M14 domain-containing protein n=1 Tax=Paenibacillus cisolokensis TaxID=1658519 RepID=A0ABQ4N2B8_9BACL|nr:M14 family metallocarboxypeptidase [Paenibacillus cisolokensis]GIQ62349.1 hypothetical protein PACILC2_09170 [Paenibacillus cisolokensis]